MYDYQIINASIKIFKNLQIELQKQVYSNKSLLNLLVLTFEIGTKLTEKKAFTGKKGQRFQGTQVLNFIKFKN